MTNEKMLQMLKKIGLENGVTNINAYMKLKQALEEDIRIQVEKKKGTESSDIQIIKRIVKCEKQNLSFGKYHLFTMKNREYKAFLNNYYLIASENDFGYEKCENPLNVQKFFKENCFENCIEIKVDKIDLKTFAKINKGKEKENPYIFQNDEIKIGVNSKYLLDVLDFCKSDTIFCTSEISLIYLKSESMDRIGLIMPIRLPKNYK